MTRRERGGYGREADLVIRAQEVMRSFGSVQAIQGLDLEVQKGRIYGFLGPNGSGKTTAIRLLTGLLKPDHGSIEVLGLSLPRDAEKLRRHIGYMTQGFSLYDDLTVIENLNFVASIHGLDTRSRKRRSEELLGIYGLQDKRRQLAGSMSGGQRQRLSLAAAVLHQPELLFLDEPTSAVDPENRREFWEQLFDLSDEGTSILVSTHYMDEAERCHRIAILDAGIKRADDEPDTLMENLGVNVVEISGDGLRELKAQMLGLDKVVSAAQLGARLRVLIKKEAGDPVAWLHAQPWLPHQTALALARPNLEDVFVVTTRNSDS